MKVNSLYLSVYDMTRAVDFYERKIFGKPASSLTERFSYFDIAGFLFCLFNPAIGDEAHIKGNNCIPTIQVERIEEYLNELKSKNVVISMDLRQVGAYHLFQCKDSESNILEFYEIKES
ncbi:MAG: VOC family protein [Thermonemataceae bacterium]